MMNNLHHEQSRTDVLFDEEESYVLKDRMGCAKG
jgi:hypothetical protein